MAAQRSTSGLSPDAGSSTTTFTGFQAPRIASFPPFYTIQPNLTTCAAQLEQWKQLILLYCEHHRIFRLSLSSPPADLFSNTSIQKSLRPSDIRTVLDYIASPAGELRLDWIPPRLKGEPSSECYIWWRTAAEWAQQLLIWVEETGQKGAVLTIYELREGDAAEQREWYGMEEAMLRKALGVLIKNGQAQIFGSGDGEGVKFF